MLVAPARPYSSKTDGIGGASRNVRCSTKCASPSKPGGSLRDPTCTEDKTATAGTSLTVRRTTSSPLVNLKRSTGSQLGERALTVPGSETNTASPAQESQRRAAAHIDAAEARLDGVIASFDAVVR